MRPVGFDNTMLSLLLNPNCRTPHDSATGLPVTFAKARAESLLDRLLKEGQRIVIPTPALSELLTAIGPGAQAYVEILARSPLFDIAAFDLRCAIELALLNRDVFAATDPKSPDTAYQKVKIDRQILAVFRVAGVTEIFTDDAGLAKRARLCGLSPVATMDLPLPLEAAQYSLPLKPHDKLVEDR